MHEWMLALSLLACGDETTPAEVPVQELVAAGKSLVDADSYAFEIAIEEARGNRDRDVPVRQPVSGSFAKGRPLRLRCGDVEAYALADKVVHRTGEGAWALLERRAADGDDAPRGSDPLALLLRVVPPHELLVGIDKNVTSVKRSAKDGTVTFDAALTAEAARHLGATRSGESGAEDDGGPEREYAGTLTLRTGAEGAVESLRVERTTKTHRDDGVRVRTRMRTIDVRDIGATQVEVPAEVTKLLEAK